MNVLGDGTFGKVWAAREISTNQMVALKQIKMSGQEGFPRTGKFSISRVLTRKLYGRYT